METSILMCAAYVRSYQEHSLRCLREKFHSSLLLGLYKDWRMALARYLGLPATLACLVMKQAWENYE